MLKDDGVGYGEKPGWRIVCDQRPERFGEILSWFEKDFFNFSCICVTTLGTDLDYESTVSRSVLIPAAGQNRTVEKQTAQNA